jgi:enoyl-[acyl-carrier protein] reductase I
VRPLAESLGSQMIIPCDVGNDAELDAGFSRLRRMGPARFSGARHRLFRQERAEGPLRRDQPPEFPQYLNISCYSFTDVARRASALMPQGGALITLTYGGASRVMPNYNVMGCAKAALEASVRYLAADLGKQAFA